MTIKSRLVRRILGLAVFFGVMIGISITFYFVAGNPFKKLTFHINDYKYDSETGVGESMLSDDGTVYTIAPNLQEDFLASDFFYDTLYGDEVEVWVKRSANENSKNIIVYGVECNGKVYLEIDAPKVSIWWLFFIIGAILCITAIVKGLQLHKVNQCQQLWKTRGYLIALYDKLGNLTLIPCSTTSYLYPNVEMMDCYYEITRGKISEEMPVILCKSWNHCYGKLANPSRLEGLLKQGYGIRSLKEFLQYKKILYIVWDEREGYYLRKMKSVLPAPEQNVYEIMTEGRHLPKDCPIEKIVTAIEEETVW